MLTFLHDQTVSNLAFIFAHFRPLSFGSAHYRRREPAQIDGYIGLSHDLLSGRQARPQRSG